MVLDRVEMAVVYPKLAYKAYQLKTACRARGADYWAISGLRTIESQNALYEQGRSLPGEIVTNAKGGWSYHNFGLALDWALDKDTERKGLQPDYAPAAYIILGEEAAKLGLEWGGLWKFKDYPHVQIPLHLQGLSLKEMRIIEAKGGLPAVWKYLDGFSW